MKIFLVAGARPNFMKIAPILRAIRSYNASKERNHLEPFLVHTGQHYDYEMSQVLFEELKLPKPDVHLGIGSGTHAEQTGKTMIEVEKVLLNEKPDLVIVVGDVNATLAGALAAAKLHIPVAHIEAGVRSNDKTMPEEINRLLADHISDFPFTTSKYDDNNLRHEGISPDRIFRVGNIMADALLTNKELAKNTGTLKRLGLEGQNYALLTLHRPSNVDSEQSLSNIMTAISDISKRIPIVFPVHPRTMKNLEKFKQRPVSGNANDRLMLIEPLAISASST